MNTATDKHNKVVRTAASVIANAIAALPAPVELASVYNVMASQPVKKNVLYEAFEMLDNQPSRFPNYMTWHPHLRSLRNHPVDGPKMFALFS